VTTFGDAWKAAIEGLAGATISLNGDFDPTATTGPAAKLLGLIGNGSTTVVVNPAGTATGELKRTCTAILTAYAESSPVGGKVSFTSSFLVTGAPTFAAN